MYSLISMIVQLRGTERTSINYEGLKVLKKVRQSQKAEPSALLRENSLLHILFLIPSGTEQRFGPNRRGRSCWPSNCCLAAKRPNLQLKKLVQVWLLCFPPRPNLHQLCFKMNGKTERSITSSDKVKIASCTI
jgi:hypothetical protein